MASCLGMEGKCAVILGVANKESIAYSIAQKLESAGCRVVLGYQERNEGEMKVLLPSFKNALAHPIEVTSDGSMDSFFAFVQQNCKTVDVMVHSIAFAKKEHLRGELHDVDRGGFLKSQEVSVFSFIDSVKRITPLMKNGASCITLSFLGAEKAVPNYNVMGVAKAALESAVRYLANDNGKRNIRINAISAGPIPTGAAGAIKGFDDLYFNSIQKSPLGRATTQDDVANVALFLSSPLSSAITGEIIHVDCGHHAVGK